MNIYEKYLKIVNTKGSMKTLFDDVINKEEELLRLIKILSNNRNPKHLPASWFKKYGIYDETFRINKFNFDIKFEKKDKINNWILNNDYIKEYESFCIDKNSIDKLLVYRFMTEGKIIGKLPKNFWVNCSISDVVKILSYYLKRNGIRDTGILTSRTILKSSISGMYIKLCDSDINHFKKLCLLAIQQDTAISIAV